ncbi:MAG: aspartate aminotransferase family protein [Sphingomonadales bacterium]|nr:aspartate aminotransferase family protein [Sphingomonadales bacterium]
MANAIMPTYAPAEIALVKGDGAYVFDEAGKRYLDFASGIAVTALGHGHPALLDALTAQAGKIWHTSNLYRIPDQERLARRLTDISFADYAFFTNSGVEAIECCLKVARRLQFARGETERYRMITFSQAFHGRTLAAVAAAGQEKLTHGFGPLPDWFDIVPAGDLNAVGGAITNETAAIMVEPVQGESGIKPMPTETLKGLRRMADDHGLALVFDEIQCGMGRSGKMFAYEWSGVEPDIMALAKGIGGGFPLGACLMNKEVGAAMTVGSHGSTYGGNPLAMAVGNAVLDEMTKDGFLANVIDVSSYLMDRLDKLIEKHPDVLELVRGLGLMIGLKVKPPVRDFIAAAREEGLITAPAGDNVMRLLPPLIITREHADEAIAIIDTACARFTAADAAE